MLKAFNRLHDMKGNISVNPFNFAINDRAYDPTKVGSYLCAYPVSATSINASVIGMP